MTGRFQIPKFVLSKTSNSAAVSSFQNCSSCLSRPSCYICKSLYKIAYSFLGLRSVMPSDHSPSNQALSSQHMIQNPCHVTSLVEWLPHILSYDDCDCIFSVDLGHVKSLRWSHFLTLSVTTVLIHNLESVQCIHIWLLNSRLLSFATCPSEFQMLHRNTKQNLH